jgi:hypothetical protein
MTKPVFHRTTIWLTAAIVFFYAYEVYEISKQWYENSSDFWPAALDLGHNLCTGAVGILFILYARIVNRKEFLARKASQKFEYMSMLFLAAAMFHFIDSRYFHSYETFEFALCILFSTITYQLSRFTDQARAAKEENDLTI